MDYLKKKFNEVYIPGQENCHQMNVSLNGEEDFQLKSTILKT